MVVTRSRWSLASVVRPRRGVAPGRGPVWLLVVVFVLCNATRS